MIELKRWPTDSRRITSPFGVRGSGFHDGIDIGAVKQGVEGDPIYAVADGVVIISKVNNGGVTKGYGYYIAIRHQGFASLYGHLQSLDVKVGQQVEAGEVVGKMGNTGSSSGAHLHFRLIDRPVVVFTKLPNGNTFGSVDPVPYLRKVGTAAEAVSPWAREASAWVVSNNISDGARPKDNVTREEVWTMLHRASKL